MASPTHGVLARILGPKREQITRMLGADRPRIWTAFRAPRPFVLGAMRRQSDTPLRLIAEIKRRSPSAGALSPRLTPAERALCYARAGASMISVLTDGPFFGGSFDDLADCRTALDAEMHEARPYLLCKEFVLHPIQLDYAVRAGADAVLLIARILSGEDLARLAQEARDRGLEPLIEVHTQGELELVNDVGVGGRLIGVNTRDLDTLEMHASQAADILGRIQPDVVAVHLSGLASADDVAQVARGRADAALIGEALMRQDDPTELLRAMRHAAAPH
jgi:indole-3-glycerol phosphate synthase